MSANVAYSRFAVVMPYDSAESVVALQIAAFKSQRNEGSSVWLDSLDPTGVGLNGRASLLCRPKLVMTVCRSSPS